MRVRLRNPDRVETAPRPADRRRAARPPRRRRRTPSSSSPTGSCVTAGHELADDAEVEIRPVISGGAGAAPRCAVCRAPAVIEEPRHRSAWCPDALRRPRHEAGPQGDRPPAGVRTGASGCSATPTGCWSPCPGGKDSLALWDVLLDLGYRVDGLYVGLGIGGYSDAVAGRSARSSRPTRGARLHVVSLAETYGYTTPSGSQASGRSTCGVCGLSSATRSTGSPSTRATTSWSPATTSTTRRRRCSATCIRWQDPFLARQRPVLPATGTNQVRKVKPLYRLSEREMAAYCVVRGIDYVVEECPLVDGNTGHELKATLDQLEAAAPGAQGPVPVRLPRQARGQVDRGRPTRRCPTSATARPAGCRPPPTCAPSAASANASSPACRCSASRHARRRVRADPAGAVPAAAPAAPPPSEGPAVEPRPPPAPVLPGTDAPLAAGELVVLTDRRGRRYLVDARGGRRVAQPRRAGAARRPHRRGRGHAPSAPTATWRSWSCGRRARTSSSR